MKTHKLLPLTGVFFLALLFTVPSFASANTQPIGSPCESDAVCASGYCEFDLSGSGAKVCTERSAGGAAPIKKPNGATCSVGPECTSGYCAYDSEAKMNLCKDRLKPIGEACSDNSDCSSDYCAYDSEAKMKLCASSSSGSLPVDTGEIDTPTTPAGGSAPGTLNKTWIEFYRDTIVWAVNFVIVPVLMAIAFIVFLYGVFKYFILGAASDTERATGRQFVLWGVIGFVVILSLWGIVNIVKQTIIPSTAGSARPAYPTL